MKKIFSILLIIALIYSCCGCGYGLVDKSNDSNNSNEEFIENDTANNNSYKLDNRFYKIYFTDDGSNFICETVLVDKETRVMYLNYGDYSGGLTVMVDADGKPLLYEGELPS